MLLRPCIVLLTTICYLLAERRSVFFRATHGCNFGFGMECTLAVELLKKGITGTFYDNQTGVCQPQPEQNYTSKTFSEILLGMYEPLFEASKEVLATGIFLKIDQMFPIAIEIHLVYPGSGDMFMTEFFLNDGANIAFKVEFGNSTMDVQYFNTNEWEDPKSSVNEFADRNGFVKITFLFIGNNLFVTWDGGSIYSYDFADGFQINQTVRYYSNMSKCHRLYFGHRFARTIVI